MRLLSSVHVVSTSTRYPICLQTFVDIWSDIWELWVMWVTAGIPLSCQMPGVWRASSYDFRRVDLMPSSNALTSGLDGRLGTCAGSNGRLPQGPARHDSPGVGVRHESTGVRVRCAIGAGPADQGRVASRRAAARFAPCCCLPPVISPHHHLTTLLPLGRA